MKNRNQLEKCLLLILLCIFTVTGCGKSPLADTYVEGTDDPYPYYYPYGLNMAQVAGGDAMFFHIGSYIYRLDKETDLLTPLCNQPNCLHDRETDRSKASECNAYLGESADGITYVDGFIYTISRESENGGDKNVLYRIADDGSVRERVYLWNQNIVESWCIHRGAMYYVEHIFNGNNQEKYTVKGMKLTGFGKLKPETIYEPEEGITVYAFANLRAYGNHLYINIDGAETDDVDALDSDDDWVEYRYNKTFQYSLEDKTISEMQIPGQLDTQAVQSLTFWQGRIIYQAFDWTASHQYDAASDVYIADLDGSNVSVLLEDVPIYRFFASDGTYLYVSDCPEQQDKIYHSDEYQGNMNAVAEMKFNCDVKVDVYNENMELVDSVTAPFHNFPEEPVYGSGDRMYVVIQNEAGDGFCIEYWDKTKLGGYHGDEYELTTICEQPYSEIDLQGMEEDSED